MSRPPQPDTPRETRRAPARARRALGDRRGVTSLELAIIAPLFFGFILGLMEVGYDLFVQAALNTAVEQAARTIQVGSVKGRTGETSAQLASKAVCPNLRGLLNCDLLTIAVAPIPIGNDYFNYPNPLNYTSAAGTAAGQVDTGCGGHGNLMILQAWYNGPTFVGTLIPNWNSIVNVQGTSRRVHVTSATAGFVDESFPGGQAVPGQTC